MISEPETEYRVCPAASNLELNDLFSSAWEGHRITDFQEVLRTSMAYICAYQADKLVGYVNVAWDGKTHAFILDTTVRPEVRLRGVGSRLVLAALNQARARGVAWVHVDFEPHLRSFYTKCGFRFSEAGVLNIASEAHTPCSIGSAMALASASR